MTVVANRGLEHVGPPFLWGISFRWLPLKGWNSDRWCSIAILERRYDFKEVTWSYWLIGYLAPDCWSHWMSSKARWLDYLFIMPAFSHLSDSLVNRHYIVASRSLVLIALSGIDPPRDRSLQWLLSPCPSPWGYLSSGTELTYLLMY